MWPHGMVHEGNATVVEGLKLGLLQLLRLPTLLICFCVLCCLFVCSSLVWTQLAQFLLNQMNSMRVELELTRCVLHLIAWNLTVT